MVHCERRPILYSVSDAKSLVEFYNGYTSVAAVDQPMKGADGTCTRSTCRRS